MFHINVFGAARAMTTTHTHYTCISDWTVFGIKLSHIIKLQFHNGLGVLRQFRMRLPRKRFFYFTFSLRRCSVIYRLRTWIDCRVFSILFSFSLHHINCLKMRRQRDDDDETHAGLQPQNNRKFHQTQCCGILNFFHSVIRLRTE